MQCQCELCQPENPAPTYTKKYMSECFERDIDRRARAFLNISSLKERQAKLASVKQKSETIHHQVAERLKVIWQEKQGGR